jgi:ADP-ribose pyrophosphatase YjhB (NUDIX family)
VSVAAAITDGDRVLAIRRRDNNKWEPPGGTLEPDETISEGLVREVREETGLEISDPRLSGVYKNMSRHIIAMVFRCEYKGTLATSTNEAAEIAWLTSDEVKERMDEAYAVRLLDALDQGSPPIRAHDGERLLP